MAEDDDMDNFFDKFTSESKPPPPPKPTIIPGQVDSKLLQKFIKCRVPTSKRDFELFLQQDVAGDEGKKIIRDLWENCMKFNEDERPLHFWPGVMGYLRSPDRPDLPTNPQFLNKMRQAGINELKGISLSQPGNVNLGNQGQNEKVVQKPQQSQQFQQFQQPQHPQHPQQPQQSQQVQQPSNKKLKTEEDDEPLDILSSTGVNLKEEEQLNQVSKRQGAKSSSGIVEGIVDRIGLETRVLGILKEFGMEKSELVPVRGNANLLAHRSHPLPYLAQSLQSLITTTLEEFIVASKHRTGLFRKRIEKMNKEAVDKGEYKILLEKGSMGRWDDVSIQSYLEMQKSIDRTHELSIREQILQKGSIEQDVKKKNIGKMSVRQQEMALPDDVKLRNQAKTVENALGMKMKYSWMNGQDSLQPTRLPSQPIQSKKTTFKQDGKHVKITVDDALFVLEKEGGFGNVLEKWKIWKCWDWIDGGWTLNGIESENKLRHVEEEDVKVVLNSRKRKAKD